MKKILFIILSCLALTSCTYKHIEDTNGVDNYSLVTLTDDDITNNVSSYVATLSSQIYINGINKVTIKKFSGVKIIDTFSKDGIINTSIILNEGNLRVCLVNDNLIEYDFDLFADDSYTFEVKNKCKLVIAGESANFKMEYTK
jgi:hypothetical protein